MPPHTARQPQDEYTRRLEVREVDVARLKALDGRLSLARGLTFVAGVLFVVFAFNSPRLLSVAVPLFLVAFIALVAVHGRVIDRLKRATSAVEYYRTGLARLRDKWQGAGADGARYIDPNHVYADDLDLFGRGSLFQLISRARTRLGEDTLAGWLLAPAEIADVKARQAAVDELRPALDLREQLGLLDAEVHDGFDQKRLRNWAAEAPQPVSAWNRIAALVLTCVTTIAAIYWLLFEGRVAPLMLALVFHVLFTFRFRRQIRELAKTTGDADFGLAILAQVLQLMESASFATPMLQQIHAKLETEGMPPSQRIAQLHRLIGALNNALQNQFYAPIAFLLCLPVHIVHGIEVWRARVGSHIPDWLEAVGQFEALSSLAGYAWEHPTDPFPELVETETAFEAEQLGHPLLPATQCVRNGIALTRETPLVIISGSNMSGKSTMLRSVGTNTVLALAGAPVCAARLRLSRLQIGSAMRIHDSLQDGKSFFYANVSRLKQIVSLADSRPPLLYLFDEILQGTNSHDRRVGAEGIIRKLLETPSIGLITTHDLALTRIADAQNAKVANMHFEDHLVDGKMTFDYRIRPGIVERSNALELMRMMGLDV